jgi:Poly A polymerase head domain
VNAYLGHIGQSEQTHRIAVIQANPEQSKHLETATFKVFGLEIDCVNLRTEEYAEDSRIPEMRFGTAMEDATRRDFTINALFYNVNTGLVEDFCRSGLDDLAQRVLRTPIAPSITFKDDPLRVVRAIRFASRMNFTFAPDIIPAMLSEEIRSALAHKVSRERMLQQLEKMVGPSCCPCHALSILYKMRYFEAVIPVDTLPQLRITLPSLSTSSSFATDIEPSSSSTSSSTSMSNHRSGTETSQDDDHDEDRLDLLKSGWWSHVAMETIGWYAIITAAQQDPSESQPSVIRNDDGSVTVLADQLLNIRGSSTARLANWAALVIGMAHLQYTDAKGKVHQLPTYLFRELIKMEAETSRQVQAILDCLDHVTTYSRSHLDTACDMPSVRFSGSGSLMQGASDDIASLIDGNIRREEAALIVRHTRECWRIAIQLACARELALASLPIPADVTGSVSTDQREALGIHPNFSTPSGEIPIVAFPDDLSLRDVTIG